MHRIISYISITFCIFILSCTSKSAEIDCTTLSGATFTSSGGKIQGIIQSKCSGSSCHSIGGTAAVHWAIEDYSKLRFHFEHMIEGIEDGDMPPAGAAKLTNEEKNLFECWSKNEFPQ
jgi:uncharacterized membrane protein